jgi:hypothetical protein
MRNNIKKIIAVGVSSRGTALVCKQSSKVSVSTPVVIKKPVPIVPVVTPVVATDTGMRKFAMNLLWGAGSAIWKTGAFLFSRETTQEVSDSSVVVVDSPIVVDYSQKFKDLKYDQSLQDLDFPEIRRGDALVLKVVFDAIDTALSAEPKPNIMQSIMFLRNINILRKILGENNKFQENKAKIDELSVKANDLIRDRIDDLDLLSEINMKEIIDNLDLLYRNGYTHKTLIVKKLSLLEQTFSADECPPDVYGKHIDNVISAMEHNQYPMCRTGTIGTQLFALRDRTITKVKRLKEKPQIDPQIIMLIDRVSKLDYSSVIDTINAIEVGSFIPELIDAILGRVDILLESSPSVIGAINLLRNINDLAHILERGSLLDPFQVKIDDLTNKADAFLKTSLESLNLKNSQDMHAIVLGIDALTFYGYAHKISIVDNLRDTEDVYGATDLPSEDFRQNIATVIAGMEACHFPINYGGNLGSQLYDLRARVDAKVSRLSKPPISRRDIDRLDLTRDDLDIDDLMARIGTDDTLRGALIKNIRNNAAEIIELQSYSQGQKRQFLDNLIEIQSIVFNENSRFSIEIDDRVSRTRGFITSSYDSLKIEIDATDFNKTQDIDALIDKIDNYNIRFAGLGFEKYRLKERLVRKVEADRISEGVLTTKLSANVRKLQAKITQVGFPELYDRLDQVLTLDAHDKYWDFHGQLGALAQAGSRADLSDVADDVIASMKRGSDAEIIVQGLGDAGTGLPVCKAYDSLWHSVRTVRGFDFGRDVERDLKYWAHLNSVDGTMHYGASIVKLTGMMWEESLMYRLRSDINAYQALDSIHMHPTYRAELKDKYEKEIRSIIYALNVALDKALIKEGIVNKSAAIKLRATQYASDIHGLKVGDHISMPGGWLQHAVYFSFERVNKAVRGEGTKGFIRIGYSNRGMGLDSLNQTSSGKCSKYSFEVPVEIFEAGRVGHQFVEELFDLYVTGYSVDGRPSTSAAMGRFLGGVVSNFIEKVNTQTGIATPISKSYPQVIQRVGNCAVSNLNQNFIDVWDQSAAYKGYKQAIRRPAHSMAYDAINEAKKRGPISWEPNKPIWDSSMGRYLHSLPIYPSSSTDQFALIKDWCKSGRTGHLSRRY